MKLTILDKAETYTNRVFSGPIIITNNKVKLVNCMFENIGKDGKEIALIIRCNDYEFHGHEFNEIGIGVIVDGRNVTVADNAFNNWYEDAIRFVKDGAIISNNLIFNFKGPENHHHDAIQWYSGDQTTSFSHKDIHTPIDVGTKRVLRDCKIIGNHIEDVSGFVQGIFGGDGLVGDMRITDNKIILPNSNHSISAWGMHEGISIIKNNDISKCNAAMRIHKTKDRQDPRGVAGDLKVILKNNTPNMRGEFALIDGVIEPNLTAPITVSVPPVPPIPLQEPVEQPVQPPMNEVSQSDLKTRVEQIERKLERVSQILGEFQF